MNSDSDSTFQFKPEYHWPDPGSQRDCPRCGKPLQLNDQQPTYFGKPWWCAACQWQFSEEDLGSEPFSPPDQA